MFKVSEGQFKLFDIDSRAGLNGSQAHWSFPCMHDEEFARFYIYLGDVSINMFTKTTFLNLVSFAEKSESKELILVMDRDHHQKGNTLINNQMLIILIRLIPKTS